MERTLTNNLWDEFIASNPKAEELETMIKQEPYWQVYSYVRQLFPVNYTFYPMMMKVRDLWVSRHKIYN